MLLISVNAQAYENIKSKICATKGYLKCIKATETQCNNANLKAERICLKKYPINTEEEKYTVAKKYGECATSEYFKALNIDLSNYKSCFSHIEPLYKELDKSVRENIKRSREQFWAVE